MEMETISLDGSTEREEGEIVDDDLEAISDDSIIATPRIGKFDSHKESLHALSLSSISDMEVVQPSPNYSFVKRKSRRRRISSSCKRRRISKLHNRRSKSDSSSDSDENVSLTKKLLQEAIRIDTKEAHSNSLRTRLKGMDTKSTVEETKQNNIKNTLNCSQDMTHSRVGSPIDLETNYVENTKVQCEELDEKGKDCQDSVEIDQDNELIQLRLEALKTAVLNKFEHRKKKKINQDLLQKPNLERNKENSSQNVNTNNCVPEAAVINCVEENAENIDAIGNSVNNSEEDEDEDILRAILLASMSNKITNKDLPPSVQTDVIYTAKNLITAPAPPKIVKANFPHPAQPKSQMNLDIPKIPRFIISVNNSDSDSDDNSLRENIQENVKKTHQDKVLQKEVENEVEKFLKHQRAEVEAKQLLPTKIPKLTIEPQTQEVKNKNIVTNNLYLLPKSKQLEYEQLIQKLKTAEKKPRVRKSSNRTSDSKNTIRNARPEIYVKNTMNNTGADSKTHLTGTLQRTLKDMQTQINGRLQIKVKYHVLTPLMRKLNEVSQEQKKHETHIKQLLNQLKEARSQCQKSQQTFHGLLKEFFKKKEEIDKRPPKENVISQPPITSTPKSEGIKNKIVAKINLPSSIPRKDNILSKPKENMQCKVVLEKCPVNLTDPNDIEFKKREMGETLTVPKYTSPLDSKGSMNNINPLEILCPFEINGACRDKGCSFNHCNKNL